MNTFMQEKSHTNVQRVKRHLVISAVTSDTSRNAKTFTQRIVVLNCQTVIANQEMLIDIIVLFATMMPKVKKNHTIIRKLIL